MFGLTYWMKELSDAGLAGAGLGHLGPAGGCPSAPAKGPVHGAEGVIFAAPGRLPGKVRVLQWTECPGGLWVGVDPEGVPGEAELRKDHQLRGEAVALRGGGVWTVPAPAVLPRVFGYSKGAELWLVAAEYRWYSDLVDGVLARGKEGLVEFTFDEARDILGAGLGLNYYVGKVEAGVLGLFDTEVLTRGLKQVLGLVDVEKNDVGPGGWEDTSGC